jgi:hypothetical protein
MRETKKDRTQGQRATCGKTEFGAEGVSQRCGRAYTREAQDLCICCICVRDLRMEAKLGPAWRRAVVGRKGAVHGLPPASKMPQ